MRTFLVLILALAVGGCASLSTSERAGAIGAAAGAAIGGLIGKKSADKPVTGVIIGAAVGGTVGAIIGRQMDKQAEELEAQLEGAEVERVGEGILVTFDSAILFAVDSEELSHASKLQLAELAKSLTEFEGTEIVVAGHTDASGEEDYNLALSERRAQSAADYLLDGGVAAERISTAAYGESQPVSENQTAAGRSANRRVEVAIYATDEYREELSTEEGNENR
ncbi:MAG: outer membrane protein OmpA-like peptidoglycan-associated protein [Rhodothermales bacterium]|jgi:outer membrane protein OmpA-like peptidoglycan-associated protein